MKEKDKMIGELNGTQVSVIITVYNTQEEYLRQCIESVLLQYERMEVIIVDDGSDKYTAFLCDEYEKKDQRIRVIHQCNLGASAARNRGIREIKGKYFTIIDSDDWLKENALSDVIEKAEVYESDIVIWNTNVVFEDIIVKNHFLPQYIESKELTDQQIQDLMIQMICPGFAGRYKPESAQVGGTWCKLYRSQFIKDNGLMYNEKLKIYEDPLFNFEAFTKAKSVYYYKEQLYNYRVSGNSVARGFKTDLDQRFLSAFDEFYILLNREQYAYKYYCALNAKIQQIFSDLIGVFFLSPQYCGRYRDRKKLFINFYNHELIRNAEKELYLDQVCKKERVRRKLIQGKHFFVIYLLYGRACMKKYQKTKNWLFAHFVR